jgi:hypothetical protein
VSPPASPLDVELVDVELDREPELDVVAALLDPLPVEAMVVVVEEVVAPPPAPLEPGAPPDEQAQRPSATKIKRILMPRSVADRACAVQPRR